MSKDKELKKLQRQLEWYKDFADAVMNDHNVYDNACEYADGQEVERYGHNYVGVYSSVHDFIEHFSLEDKAEEVFGENWEAENDIEQIQELVGDEYIVQEIKPKSKREKRADDYIKVIKRGE